MDVRDQLRASVALSLRGERPWYPYVRGFTGSRTNVNV